MIPNPTLLPDIKNEAPIKNPDNVIVYDIIENTTAFSIANRVIGGSNQMMARKEEIKSKNMPKYGFIKRLFKVEEIR